ncbi:MAG: hypothetical protein JWQ58_1009 [Reyranella sp.]|nr:hypothetical protein [Reyranella sp.]
MEARQQEHRENLEEEATHATDEARMVLPGIQAILGFQLIAVFNQRFESLTPGDQVVHLAAFFLSTLAMGLVMAPAAYHRQRERGRVTRRFVDLASNLLTFALAPLMLGLALDTYILVGMVVADRTAALAGAVVVIAVLGLLWFVMPRMVRK